MRTEDILQKLDIALKTLFSNDLGTIERGLNERLLAAHLAHYLQPLFQGYNVDCEYNGDTEKETDRKSLEMASNRLIEIGWRLNADDNYSITPDIIIHERGRNDRNIAVIEVKKDISDKKGKEYDLLKLEHLTIDYSGNHYNYQLGIALIINTDNNAGTCEKKFFQKGIQKNIEELEQY
jgi:hypothetical protein